MATGGGSNLGVSFDGEPANETEAELRRVRNQNDALKQQVEALNHVQAKLVAKNKRYRDMHKSNLESQIGIFNPGDIPDGEQMPGLMAGSAESLGLPGDGKGTRNADGTLISGGGKGSLASMGKESMVSLPDETKIKAQLGELIESEEEDELFV